MEINNSNEKDLNKKSVKQNKYKLKNKINRCHYLYDKYGEDLKYVKFKLKPLCDIGDEKWEKWLKILDDEMKKANLGNIHVNEETMISNIK